MQVMKIVTSKFVICKLILVKTRKLILVRELTVADTVTVFQAEVMLFVSVKTVILP